MAFRLPDIVDAFKPYAGQTVTIPMSGGADSTLLALKAIDAGCNVRLLRLIATTPTKAYEMHYSSNLDNAITQYARKCDLKVSTKEYKVNLTDAPGACYTQMAWWISVLPLAIGDSCPVIAMGWLASDGTAQLANDFRNAIACARAAAYRGLTDVIFPILTHAKEHVLDILAAYGEGITKNVWWCEYGATWDLETRELAKTAFEYDEFDTYHEQCGKCHSCQDALGFVTRWNGDSNGRSEYIPMNMPPTYMLKKYPLIHISSGVFMIRQASELVAKRYRVKNIPYGIKSFNDLGAKKPYVVKATNRIFNTESREIKAISLQDAIMNRHDDPVAYSRAIEHLAIAVFDHLAFDKVKDPIKRLRDIVQLLKMSTDLLWPIPTWYGTSVSLYDEERIKGASETC